MAHLRPIPQRRCSSAACGRKATVELYNRFNASCGFYCGPHGREAERELQGREGVPAGDRAKALEEREAQRQLPAKEGTT